MKRVFYNYKLADEAGIYPHGCPHHTFNDLGVKFYRARSRSLCGGWEFLVDDNANLSLFNLKGIQYVQELECENC